MNSSSDATPDATSATPVTRPLYWSVRRELWENRSIYIAPLIVAVVALIGYSMSAAHLPERRRALLLLDEAHQRAGVTAAYGMAALMILLTAFIVGLFYCLDALHGERRDRSILFWKSLPVSDLTTVLSKTITALVVLPLVTFAVIMGTHLLVALLSNAILLASGLSFATISPQLRFFPSPLVVLYGVMAAALWHAPIYGWALLVSGWARRATFLCAVLPLFGIVVAERMAFNTSHFGGFLRYRVSGWFTEAFSFTGRGSLAFDPMTQVTPGHFLSLPALWLGLVFFALCLAAAVRLRRYRGPL